MSQQTHRTHHGFILIAILIVAAIIRFWYISYAGGSIILMPDSQGYYTSEGFFGPKVLTNFYNPHRTPGYAILSSLAMTITHLGHPTYQSPEFFSGTWIIILFQTLMGLLSLIVLYDTLLSLKISPKLTLAFTALTAINIYQFIWDRAFLTESLYISLFIILMRLFVSLLNKPKTGIGFLFIFLAAIEFLLRPSGLALPYLLLPIIWIVHKTKKVLLFIVLLLTVYTMMPASFVVANRMLFGFKGIGYNTDFSIFGRILLFNMPIDSAASIPNLYKKITEYRQNGGNVSIPWYFFVYDNNEVYGRLGELQQFNKLVIRAQPWLFAQTVFSDIPKAFWDTNVYGVLYQSTNQSVSHKFFAALDWIITILERSTILFLLFAPLSLWQFAKKPTKLHAFLAAIAILELYQLFSSLIFGGAWEFARHMITTQTYLFFFCFWWIAHIFSLMYKRR